MLLRRSILAASMAACCAFSNPLSTAQTAAATTQVSPSKSMDVILTSLEKDFVPLAQAMPEDKYNFAPSADIFKPGLTPDYKGVRTFAQEIAHVAQGNYGLFLAVQGIEKPDAELTAKMAAVAKLTSKADLVKALQDSFTFAHTAIATLTVANAWDHAGRGPDDSRAQRAAYAMAHCRDHYGQMVEYLRMNGIIPPASQGRPSANPPKTM